MPAGDTEGFEGVSSHMEHFNHRAGGTGGVSFDFIDGLMFL